MTDPTIQLRPCAGPAEFPRLVEIWHSAVAATHHFLAPADFADIENHLAGDYFPEVDLTVATVDGGIVGFSGLASGQLEMLFIEDGHRGRGVGSALLHAALDRYPSLTVDVNEQNSQALGFYRRHGFVITGRSDTDSEGRPYPLVHLVFTVPGD
ncbi:acetyltransferase [Nocardia sp. BMG51109]|uniref:acetyltransferase n=1 Tax=Nocardia sp. BMG51109 TaxID=1056816 RepID=UPI00046450ED|nr:acetyltransferase [Nocardia sp. BMG51109]